MLGIVGESIVGAGTLFLILAVAVAALVVLIYNRLITLRNRFLNSFSQIEVQLQRRYELIPNLVETARAYICLLYTSPSPRDATLSRMPSSA